MVIEKKKKKKKKRATSLTMDSCFSELALYKFNKACWSSSKSKVYYINISSG